MTNALDDAFQGAADDPDAKVIILSGIGSPSARRLSTDRRLTLSTVSCFVSFREVHGERVRAIGDANFISVIA